MKKSPQLSFDLSTPPDPNRPSTLLVESANFLSTLASLRSKGVRITSISPNLRSPGNYSLALYWPDSGNRSLTVPEF